MTRTRRTTSAIVTAATATATASLLAGCASYLPVNAAGDRTALPPAARAADTPSPSPTPQAYAPSRAPGRSGHDTCGAAALAYLVGRPRSELPVPTDPARRRVVCTTCPLTRDVVPDRQTVTYDARSGSVVAVTCG